MSEIISNQLLQYTADFTSEESLALQGLERKTYKDVLLPNMLSGKVQGRFLSFISRMLRPTHILEIGTFTGYSAICLAEGLSEDGQLITIDINDEREELINEAIQATGFQDKILCKTGSAAEIIPTINKQFDLVFIDADKVNYGLYFDLVIDKVRSGGIILVDNVLWRGEVVDEDGKGKAKMMRDFNEKVLKDLRVENVIITIRDGINMIYKK
ncbi:MAG: O-methyltransferase [Chitinophagales bacterium]|nr:O-methyltransferase [Chitinophagales bacterium]